MKKFKRWNKILIENALKYRRVVILAGPRQCGKTTLTKEFVSENTLYRTLDDHTLLQAAQNDPTGFLQHTSHLMIIDELQRAPLLLPAIKKIVDEDTRPGQFLVTGSSNIQSLPGVTESLAGRVKKLRLRPLSEGEIKGRQPTFLENAFAGSFGNYDVCNRDDIINIAFRGGFPEAVSLENPLQRRSWHRDYLESLIERDLKDILNIQRQDSMKELLVILAAWSSKFMDVSHICSGLSIQRPTVESYINALEALYLFERVLPWIKTDYDRVAKHAKIFMTDSGLMASTLNWRIDDIRFDSDKIGKLIETFVFNELSAQIDFSDGQYTIYHYRDREKREIDFLIERDDGSLLGIEVKAGSTINKDSFKHLEWFKNNLAKEKSFSAIILYTGETPASFGNKMWAVPISALW